jgi:hypothetical protein
MAGSRAEKETQMKFTIALVAALVAGLAASFAVAAPAKTSEKPAGTDTTTTTTSTTTTTTKDWKVCRPRAAWILKGTLVSVAGNQLSFTMDVKRVNRHARLLESKTVTVQVGEKTRIWRLGKKVTLGDLTLGDRLHVRARFCKKSSDAIATLRAAWVVARPAKAAPTVTTTTATTTTTSTTPAIEKVCRRHRFALILGGTLASVADDQLSFTMDVKRANRHARLYRSQTVTVQVGEKTRIWRLGKKVALNTLTIGDRLHVRARVCKKSGDTAASIYAAWVIAGPAKVAPTTTATTTTTTTP